MGRWLVHGGRAIKYVVMMNCAAGHKSHQNLPTDCPDEPKICEAESGRLRTSGGLDIAVRYGLSHQSRQTALGAQFQLANDRNLGGGLEVQLSGHQVVEMNLRSWPEPAIRRCREQP